MFSLSKKLSSLTFILTSFSISLAASAQQICDPNQYTQSFVNNTIYLDVNNNYADVFSPQNTSAPPPIFTVSVNNSPARKAYMWYSGIDGSTVHFIFSALNPNKGDTVNYSFSFLLVNNPSSSCTTPVFTTTIN